RIRIGKPDRPADRLYVGGLAGKKGPAWAGAIALPVFPDRLHCVFLRLQSEGIHVDVATNLVAEQLLHPGQIGGNQGANLVTVSEKEVERHRLVLDQVIVEEHLFALMRSEEHTSE